MVFGTPRIVVLASLWVSVAAGFFVWRLSAPLIWCDTVVVANNLFEESDPILWSDPGAVRWIIRNSFYDVGSDGYRPLSRIVFWTGTALFSDRDSHSNLYFAAVGILFGTLATCVFLVARRFLHSELAALFAVFIFLFSTPVVTAAWNLICGIQAFVPLMICLGLLFYWKVADSSKHKIWYMGGLCGILLIGPWFREFVGLLPLLIIFLEAQRAKRPTLTMGVAGIFFLHSIFPTAIVRFTVFPDLPLHPVFAMGHLGHQVAANLGNDRLDLISRILSGIKWETLYHFMTLFPSVLFILVTMAFLLPIIRLLSALLSLLSVPKDQRQSTRIPWTLGSLLPLVFLLGGVCVLGLYNMQWFLLWLCSGFVFFALFRDVFLACWFLLFLLPFLRIFTEQVHLAYALLPASIIIAAALEELWRSVRFPGIFFTAARYGLLSVVAVAIADHSLNPYNSYRVVQSINQGIMKMAAWFSSHVPAGSIVVANTLHAEDIRLFSNDHIKVFWTVRAGIPRDEDAVDEPSALEELLKDNHTKRDVYFLDVDFNYALEKLDYHSHKYVRNRSVDMSEIGLAHTTQVRYPFIDPLKIWVPRSYIAFLGAPDLENDFYRGPAQNGAPFMREVYAEYYVYKAVGTAVQRANSTGPLQLLKEDYRGFNILVLNGRFFGLPQTEGAFDLKKIREKQYAESFEADSYDEILRQIDLSLEQKGEPNQSVMCRSLSLRQAKVPTLIEEGYRRYNIIAYGARVYAIPQGEGEFALDRFQKNEYSRSYSDCSTEAVKRQIDQFAHQQ
jgi:hypothetical protein